MGGVRAEVATKEKIISYQQKEKNYYEHYGIKTNWNN